MGGEIGGEVGDGGHVGEEHRRAPGLPSGQKASRNRPTLW
jgi:hypothetical protein